MYVRLFNMHAGLEFRVKIYKVKDELSSNVDNISPHTIRVK